MLPKENRLTKKHDFDLIWKKGNFFGTKSFNLKYMENGLPHTRVGFVVGTKVSKLATKRNKLKRQMREVIRLNLGKIKSGFDISITARPGSSGMEYVEVEKNLTFALKKTSLLK